MVYFLLLKHQGKLIQYCIKIHKDPNVKKYRYRVRPPVDVTPASARHFGTKKLTAPTLIKGKCRNSVSNERPSLLYI